MDNNGILTLADISRWNNETSLKQAQDSGLDGIIMKAGQWDKIDPTFQPRMEEAITKTSLVRGAYYFCDPSKPWLDQLMYFCDMVKDYLPLLLVADIEAVNDNPDMGWNNRPEEENIDGVKSFLAGLVAKFQGPGGYIFRPGFYTYENFFKTAFPSAPDFSNLSWLYLARYAGVAGATPPGFSSGWTIWQTSDKFNIPGLGAVDRDQYNGTLAGLKSLQAVKYNG